MPLKIFLLALNLESKGIAFNRLEVMNKTDQAIKKLFDLERSKNALNNAKLKINVALTLSKNTDEVQKVLEIFENSLEKFVIPQIIERVKEYLKELEKK